MVKLREVDRVLEDVLRSVSVDEPSQWSALLAQVEFAINTVHSSTGFASFYVNGLLHPRTPLSLPMASSMDVSPMTAEVLMEFNRR